MKRFLGGLAIGIAGTLFFTRHNGKPAFVANKSATDNLPSGSGDQVAANWRASGNKPLDELYNWFAKRPKATNNEKIAFEKALLKMTPAELADTHDYVFKYVVLQQLVSKDPALQTRMAAIAAKYNIFD